VLLGLWGGLLLATPSGALAQAGADGSAALCWRGRPAAQCSSFLVTEFALSVGPKKPARRPPVNGSWELGAMKNVSPTTAVGASAFVIHDDESRYLLGIRPRARHWLSNGMSVDLGLGIILHDLRERSFIVEVPSFTGRVGLDWGDRFGVFAKVEVLSIQERPQSNPTLVGTQAALYMGLRFGSDVGVLASAIAAGLVHWSNNISS
jgi:hypothetical protein